MPFLTRRPSSPQLAGTVEQLWWSAGEAQPHRFERMLPTGRAQLLIELGGGDGHGRRRQAFLAGVHEASRIIGTAGQREVMGAVLSPIGAARLAEGSAEPLVNADVELTSLWGHHGAVVRERVLAAFTPASRLATLEAILVERVSEADEQGGRIARAIPRLDLGLKSLCAELGTTERTFRRHFRRHVGVAPKRYARIARLGRVLRALERGSHQHRGRVDWAGLALAAGYYDQPHLVHDFDELAGVSPTAYRPRSPGEIHHVPLDVGA